MILSIATSVLAATSDGEYDDLSKALSESGSNNSNNGTGNGSGNGNGGLDTSALRTNNNPPTTAVTPTNTNNNTNTNLPNSGMADSLPVVVLIVISAISAVYAYKKIQDYKSL